MVETPSSLGDEFLVAVAKNMSARFRGLTCRRRIESHGHTDHRRIVGDEITILLTEFRRSVAAERILESV